MGELIKFPVFKKETTEKEENCQNKEIDFSSIEERTAIDTLSRERYAFILNLKRNNPALKYSDAYRDAYDLLVNRSRVDIANMINNVTEAEMKIKPAYFIAAFNILCDTI